MNHVPLKYRQDANKQNKNHDNAGFLPRSKFVRSWSPQGPSFSPSDPCRHE
jgi:hypothetical protein